jgi:hypothetical protein
MAGSTSGFGYREQVGSSSPEGAMRAIGRWGVCAVALVLVLQGVGEAQTEPKSKAVRITNKQAAPAGVYINFAADSVLKPTALVEAILLPK